MTHDNPVALVTGANQGIGLQISRELASNGFTVPVGSRNLERGESAAEGVEYARTIQPSVVSFDEMRAVWETNVFGPLAVFLGHPQIRISQPA